MKGVLAQQAQQKSRSIEFWMMARSAWPTAQLGNGICASFHVPFVDIYAKGLAICRPSQVWKQNISSPAQVYMWYVKLLRQLKLFTPLGLQVKKCACDLLVN